jgi:hypothetical protein
VWGSLLNMSMLAPFARLAAMLLFRRLPNICVVSQN